MNHDKALHKSTDAHFTQRQLILVCLDYSCMLDAEVSLPSADTTVSGAMHLNKPEQLLLFHCPDITD